METKKKYVVLNMQQRLDVLKDLKETSLSLSKLGQKYGVNVKTIRRIKKNAEKINTFADKSKFEKKRQKIISPVYADLDKHLLAWYRKRRQNGERITDAALLEKAVVIKERLPSCKRCKVSRGWLSKFKRRHGIRLAHVKEDKSGTDDEADKFISNLIKLVGEDNINLENIYNMYESGLAWKALPAKSLTTDGDNITGYKFRKDKISIGICANALGTHKITPLIIYKFKNPRALKNEISLPVILKSQENASMDGELFVDWFENDFKPSVREYQARQKIPGKVILLLNNCDSHKVSPEIQEDEHFKIMYIPTSLIPPMNRGIIDKTKQIFRHKLLQRVLTYENRIDDFYKDYSIKDCIDILSTSWSEITQNFIRNAWAKIIGPVIPSDIEQVMVKLEPDWPDLISTITGKECTEQQVTEFLSVCNEADSKNEDIIKEEIIEDEPPPELNEMIYDESNNENVRNELRLLFERLEFYSARAPTCIQWMVQGLKIFFLGKEH